MKNLDLAIASFFIIIMIGVVIECSCEQTKKHGGYKGWKCNKTHCVKVEGKYE